ncbi:MULTISPECIES: bifunctional UDP-sugar hydrolase/5'-nucleotidase [unclassified Pseudactinotalea]|uniref:bifunctional metallophosphatase/5'-nucleotidase n=1 Tax=unclassified Pseudactinotalea TaxID=2649176 RepID=UPI00128C33B6|nr:MULTISPECIES: 5'-nucleotidase C-terminal domain-containing protein [unclassified Pseudactinotalea]MPV48461.1 bifunctional metallophosphatase/5'-nucleotidase [Pseudactinotalea sp. HY160]QGH68439.1 bifunctional metallophosphatase/5'-nucleotidase [Pseudactinotalea sp. HY158]
MRLGTMTAGRASWRGPAAALGVAALALAGVATAVPAAADIDGDTLTVDLVGVNDFHGRIDEGLKVSTDADGTVTIADENTGAAARLAAAVEDVRADNADTVFVGAGDLFGASTFTSMIGDDIPTTDVFNAMGLDVSSVGNHEFDQGIATLKERIDGTGDFAGHALDWPYLGANVYDESTGDPALQEYDVIETANGASIAFIGVVTQETPSLVTPAGIAGLDFGDPADAVDRVIEENTEVADADAIVVLIHDGGANAAAVTDTATHFGRFVQDMADRGDIAGIFSGHTHVMYEVAVDGMPVIQTGSFGANLGRITLSFAVTGSGDTRELSLSGAASDMIPLSWKDDEGATVYYPVPEGNDVVDAVKDVVRTAVEAAEELGGQVIGHVSDDLNRAVQSEVDAETGEPIENRGGESTIGNLIADAQIWAIDEQAATDDLPVVAFMNPGGIRTDIKYGTDGTVTYKQAATVQPFANTLNTFDLTGAQIKQVLEEQWQPEGASRPFLKLGLSGMWYFYDPAAPTGEHITYVEIGGEQLDPDATYRVVANNFLASGGDNFTTLGEGADYADSGIVDLAAFVDYFKAAEAAGEVVTPDYDQRAIGVHWNTSQEDTYRVGEEISLDLSSMLFSTNEPKPEVLGLALVNPDTEETVDLGTTPLDPSIVDTTDEVGRAQVRLTVPEIDGLGEDPQAWRLQVTDAVNGYSVWFGVALTAAAASPTPTDTASPTPTPTTSATPAPTPSVTVPGGSMPDTGADVDLAAIVGVLLLLNGAAAVAVARRRRSSARD